MTSNRPPFQPANLQISRPKTSIPQINKQSLMQLMKQIMEKSFIFNDELQCVVEESNECSVSAIDALASCQMEKKEQKENNSDKNSNSEIESNSNSSKKDIDSPNNNLIPIQINLNVKDVDPTDSGPQRPIPTNHTEQSSGSEVSSGQFDKLIEITSRCVEYYNKFSLQKSAEISIIEKTFTDLSSNLDMAFSEIISEAQRTQKQLKQFLIKKYHEILAHRQAQDNGLKTILEDIRSVHLNNIIQKKKNNANQTQNKQSSQNQFLAGISNLSGKMLLDSYCSDHSEHLSVQLHNYASTLNQFYLQMEEIQKCNFKEMVEQSVSFINNLICEQLKVLITQKIPSKLCEKKMMREKSQDFLNEDNYNDQRKYQGQNLGFLDFQSMTKLFMDSSKLNDRQEQNNNGPSKLEQIISLIEMDKKKQKTLYKNKAEQKVLTSYNSNQFRKQKSQQKSLTNFKQKSPIKTYHITTTQRKQSNPTHNSLSQSQQKINFHKKERHEEVISNKKNQNQQAHKQNSLQLIKKISSQQNNRSAKIKGYMVSFEEPIKNKATLKNNEDLKTSKSPQKKLCKTPTKLSQSNEKKVLTSVNSMITSSEVKMKSSQQSSLKSSRNLGYISEFKIGSSRRQSVTIK